MSDDQLLDHAAQLIADARAAAIKLGVSPGELSTIMMDEAALGWMAEGNSLSEIQQNFRRYAQKRLPKFYAAIKRAAGRK